MTSTESREPKGSASSSTNCDHSTCGWKPRYYGPDGECLHPNRYNYALSGNAVVTRYYSCPDCKSSWEEEEAKGSESSSTDICGKPHPDKGWPCTKRAGLFHMEHATSGGHPGYASALYWGERDLPVEQIHKWRRCTHCSHREHSARCMEVPVPGTWSWTGRCGCLELTSAREIEARCKGAGGCPEHPTERQKKRHEPLLEICACTHPRQKHRNLSEDTVICEGGGLPCSCDGFEDEAPPLTPEEEEEECSHIGSRDIGGSNVPGAHWTRFHCDNCGKEWVRNWETEKAVQDPPPALGEEEAADCGCGEPEGAGAVHRMDGPCYIEEPPPPQPERRPPHVYSYSVQGHLYEVALSGDATVVAQDGALIITHSLGPVAGIVQARPLEGEQS